MIVASLLLVGCAARPAGPLHDVQKALEEIHRANESAQRLGDSACTQQQRVLLASTQAAAQRAAAAHREHLAEGQADSAAQDHARVLLAAGQAQGLRASLERCEG